MKITFYIVLIVSIGVMLAASICEPQFLADNAFLKNFINHEILNILAVIMTVTAASAANIHLAFNRAEESYQKLGLFDAARKDVNSSIYVLIALFALTVVLLIARSSLEANPFALSIINGSCLIVLLVNILVLIDITSTIFSIHPHLRE